MDPSECAADQATARYRLAYLDAILLAVDRRAEVLELVSAAADHPSALAKVAETFGLSEFQATAVLDLQVRRFSRAERARIRQERDEVRAGLGQ